MPPSRVINVTVRLVPRRPQNDSNLPLGGIWQLLFCRRSLPRKKRTPPAALVDPALAAELPEGDFVWDAVGAASGAFQDWKRGARLWTKKLFALILVRFSGSNICTTRYDFVLQGTTFYYKVRLCTTRYDFVLQGTRYGRLVKQRFQRLGDAVAALRDRGRKRARRCESGRAPS